MKKIVTVITLVSLIMGTHMALANSVTYKISVTIPAIAGVNAPGLPTQTKARQQQTDSNLESSFEEIVRHNQTFLLETIVAR